MYKKILIEYADMKEEIKDLRRRIEKDEREIGKLDKNTATADTAFCGKKEKRPLPAALVQKKERILEREIALLHEMEIDLLEKQTQAEEYIWKIEKSELRIMFRLYFIDNLSYTKVAWEMNRIFPKRKIKYTDENVRKRISRFFENVQSCPGPE